MVQNNAATLLTEQGSATTLAQLYITYISFFFFFFFYGGSLMDVASQTAWRNSPLSSACLPASTVETPIHSPMSCVHLLLGLPLPFLPSHVPSKNSFSNVLCRLMWPKYDSFCFLIRFILATYWKSHHLWSLDNIMTVWIRRCLLIFQTVSIGSYLCETFRWWNHPYRT